MHVLPKILILLFVLPDLWARPDFRDSAAVDQTAEGLRKLNELQSRTNRCKSMFIAGDSESNSCGVVLDIQTPQEYAKFLFQAPRPYHLFVLFTMKGCCNIRRGHCNKSCGRAEASFRTVAARWEVDAGRVPSFFREQHHVL